MSGADERQMVVLAGSSNPESAELRTTLLAGYLRNVEEKVNHIDRLRDRNMSISVVIFAALFGFGARFATGSAALLLSSALGALMVVGCARDRRLHRISHGWRGTKRALHNVIAKSLSQPDAEISYPMYVPSAEAEAEWAGRQPVLCYLLIAGSAASWWIFNGAPPPP